MLRLQHALRRIIITCFVLLLLIVNVSAQSATLLNPDELTSGSFSEDAFAQVFLFNGVAGDVVSIGASGDIALSMLVTNSEGESLAQVIGDDQSVATEEITLVTTGTFFVTVLPAPGVEASGEFSVILVPVSTGSDTETTTDATQDTTTAEPVTNATVLQFTEPEQILLANGINVTLSWDAPVDLNLEIRDPFGNSLYWDNRSTPIGGSFGFDANGLCEIITPQPVETASFPPGFLPSGSYELLIFYRQACELAETVPFTVNATVDGVQLDPITAALAPPVAGQNSVYVANFIVAPDGTPSINLGGLYPDSSIRTLPAPVPDILGSATPIAFDAPVRGAIVGDQDYLSYSFQAEANEVISVDLQNVSGGSLDTLLQVVDANGAIIDVNDDSNASRNSSLQNVRLTQSGTYTIVATRYGKELGGTEGEFELTLTGATTGVPSDLTALNLPQGDISFSLTWGTSADLQLLVRDPAGDAVFDDRPQIGSGGILSNGGNVNCTIGTTPTPASHIYWPFGFLRPGIYEVEVWYQSNCNDTRPVEFTLTGQVDGQAVMVERQRPIQGQRFIIAMTINPDRTVTVGQGGYFGGGIATFDLAPELPNAAPIQIGQPVLGSITPDNAFDVYALEATAGQIITIRMSATSQTLDTKVFLVSPEGVELADNDDADPSLAGTTGRTTDSIINAVLIPTDGTYYIVTSRFGTVFGGTIGGYNLIVE